MTHILARRRAPLSALIVAVAILVIPALALPAAAADLTTDYPAIEVQAGQNVTIPLHLSAPDTERVALAVADAPKGWTADLQGGGFTVGGAYVGPDQTPAVTLHVAVPDDAATGTYHINVTASGKSGTATLPVDITVVAEASGAYTLTSDFAQLQGTTKDTFSFSLTLGNNTGAAASFALAAQGPQGWTVSAAPASQNKASAVDVDAGGTATVTVTANPPADVQAGTYELDVTATGAGKELTEKLTVEVTGSPALTMSTADQVLNATGSAGKTTDVHLTLQNTGSAPLEGVTLASTPPSGWTVTFEPKSIDTIAAGDKADVVAHIQPSGDAITGDYQVTLSANSSAVNSSVDLRYTVQTSSWWGLVGVIVIALAIVVLLWLFRRYGRR